MANRGTGLFSIASTSALSYMIADVIHEVIGHAGASLLRHHKIMFLSSVYFKSNAFDILTDIGGPLASLSFGCLFLYLFNKMCGDRLLLFQLAAYNLFWFAGGVLESAWKKNGDWTFAVRTAFPDSLTSLLFATAGTLFYLLFIGLLNLSLNCTLRYKHGYSLTRKLILSSFLFASISALITGLFFRTGKIQAATEGFIEMLGSLPVLVLTYIPAPLSNELYYQRSLLFNYLIFLLYLIFCITLGIGINY